MLRVQSTTLKISFLECGDLSPLSSVATCRDPLSFKNQSHSKELSPALPGNCLQQTDQVVSVFFFHRQDAFQHPPRGGIVRINVSDHLAITVDSDALRHQVFLDYVDQISTFDIF